jgi:hemoglobin
VNIYENVGGEKFFIELVDRFYEGVENDPILRPLYPEEDLTGAKRRLHLFLMQYFGGPQTYSLERGHPRLRLRHLPFDIGRTERDAWMKHMLAALKAVEAEEEAKVVMLDYFDRTATFLMNQE